MYEFFYFSYWEFCLGYRSIGFWFCRVIYGEFIIVLVEFVRGESDIFICIKIEILLE